MTIPEEEVEAAAKAIFNCQFDWHGECIPVSDMSEGQARDIARAALLAAAKVRGARERNAVIEECAAIADMCVCGNCGLDGISGTAIRALKETGQ